MCVCVHVVQGASLKRYDIEGKKPFYKARLPEGHFDSAARNTKTLAFCTLTGCPRTAEDARAEALAWLVSYGHEDLKEDVEEEAQNEGMEGESEENAHALDLCMLVLLFFRSRVFIGCLGRFGCVFVSKV